MRLKYHLYRNPRAHTDPNHTTLRCVKCGAEREGVPTPAELSQDNCGLEGQWLPPCWKYEGVLQDNERRISVYREIEGGAESAKHLIARLSLFNDGSQEAIAAQDQLSTVLDWLLFNGLVDVIQGKFEVTELGRWMGNTNYRMGRRPVMMLHGEHAALNRARARRSCDIRNGNTGVPRGQLTNLDHLKLLLLGQKIAPTDQSQIDALAKLITERFSLRLKKPQIQ